MEQAGLDPVLPMSSVRGSWFTKGEQTKWACSPSRRASAEETHPAGSGPCSSLQTPSPLLITPRTPSTPHRNCRDEAWMEETEAWRGLPSLSDRMRQRHVGFTLCWPETHETQMWLLSPQPLLAREGAKRQKTPKRLTAIQPGPVESPVSSIPHPNHLANPAGSFKI